MSNTIVICTLLLITWIRGPISRAARAGEAIANELKRIREMGERGRSSR